MLHTRFYFLFVFFVLPKMEASNFESIFECISYGVNKVLVLVLVLLVLAKNGASRYTLTNLLGRPTLSSRTAPVDVR